VARRGRAAGVWAARRSLPPADTIVDPGAARPVANGLIISRRHLA